MKKFKTFLFLILICAVVAGGYFGYTAWYDYNNYLITDNASVSANTVTITPNVTGNVIAWNVVEGSDVKSGQILGKQDLGTLVNSSDVNVKSLNTQADSLVGKADIKTPISGKVVVSNITTGQTLAPSMTAAIVAETNNMFIKANIEETSILKIKQGQKVTVSIDAYPNKLFTGVVDNVGLATQSAFSTMPSLNTSGTFTKVTQLIPVKINIVNNENLPLIMGMNATVKINIKQGGGSVESK